MRDKPAHHCVPLNTFDTQKIYQQTATTTMFDSDSPATTGCPSNLSVCLSIYLSVANCHRINSIRLYRVFVVFFSSME